MDHASHGIHLLLAIADFWKNMLILIEKENWSKVLDSIGGFIEVQNFRISCSSKTMSQVMKRSKKLLSLLIKARAKFRVNLLKFSRNYPNYLNIFVKFKQINIERTDKKSLYVCMTRSEIFVR